MTKILLVPWGDPSRWGEINYCLDGDRAKSISTIKLLSKKYDKVIILSLDSLIDIKPGSGSYVYDAFKETIEKYREEEHKNYTSIVNCVNSFVEKVVNKIGVNNVTNVVLPAYGSPGGLTSFNGKPEDYISVGIWKIEKLLEQYSGNIEELSLDLTTGMNFITSLSTIMLDMIGDLELAKNDRNDHKINIRYYNSEPYNPVNSNKDYSILMVHKFIKDRLTFPYLTIHDDSQDLLKKLKQYDLPEEVKNINSAHLGYVLSTMKAVYFSIPLALKYYVGKSVKSNILEFWENNISVTDKSVERNMYMNPNRVYALLYSNIILDKVSENKSLSDIEKEVKKIYPKVNPISIPLIHKELSNLRKAIEKLKNTNKEEEIYKNLTDFANENNNISEVPNESENKINKRNLIAHAGFPNEFVKIFKNGTLEYTLDVKDILSTL